ncbi:hypothetical protein B0T26DRAFT_632953 [Lasiosphaeria miniovina]|uniref:Rhodopsin domain-containing protein n=1 Tax=Lasiosphaeria miniovina TaxID=1954250 RepID=A0AA40E956_9PEZI|nr:uncharacterized protein B0T26DRAFT_632953 [Lasiosphaeria miniovina]KAK0732949.1 hypothetical protein B0T26DRAFT_632953 [Lasiosphaeria miniovina]
MSGLFTQPPVDPDAPGISHTTIAVTWVFTCLAIITVAVRCWVRKKYHRWNSDEWIMLAALALQITYQAFITLACNWGMGKDFINMTLEEFMQSQKWEFFAITPAQLVSLVARISIVILLARIFGTTRVWFKWFLFGFMALQVVVGVLGLVFSWVSKFPIETHWNPMIVPTSQMDERINQYTSLALQFLFAISDLLYVVMPVWFVWRVQMKRNRKIGLIILLSLSIVTAGASITKIVIIIMGLMGTLPDSFSPDFGGTVFLTSSIEQSLVIIMGCIPTLGPLSKLQYTAFFSAVGDSIISLLTTRRRSPRGSATGSVYPGGEDVEMGGKLRISDEASARAQKPAWEAGSGSGPGSAKGSSKSLQRTVTSAITYYGHTEDEVPTK